jgi:DNA-binding Lrp family transcriptional regulator
VERAFVCVTAKPALKQKVLNEIKAVEGVESANSVVGPYDVCFSVKKESLDKLQYVLSEKITRMTDVRETLTLFRTGLE